MALQRRASENASRTLLVIYIHTFSPHVDLSGYTPVQLISEGFLQPAQSPEGYRHAFEQPLVQQKKARAESDQTRVYQSECPRDKDTEKQ